MLIKDFYKVVEVVIDKLIIVATINLNTNHEVYKGHFPNQPIVPGVIQLQIIKEILENHIEKKLLMSDLIQVKYLIPIVPGNYPQILISISQKNIDEKSIRIDASIGIDDIVFTKAKLTFKF